jgi:hypothetical protein
MRHAARILFVLAGLLLIAGCDSRVERTDGGGVLLSVSDFDGVPIRVSIATLRGPAGLGFVQVGSITIQSIIRDIDGQSSDLMNVEFSTYEVVYTRADNGTRVPPPLVERIFGSVTPGGTINYLNLPILRSDQFDNPPLSDLFVERGGFDKETGRTSIVLNVSIRFFGRSLAGEAVDTAPAVFTVEFVP